MASSVLRLRAALTFALVLGLSLSAAAQQEQPFEPQIGQPGKDVVWVPTPPALVERMLDLANVTADDVVVDLGSGDGRNVIAAAKRGARARGVEYNPNMVALSRRNAAAEGVGGKATFIEGDMYEADFQDATVLALFLLPSNMEILRPKFFDLRPGSRIVSNTFGMDPWTPDETVRLDEPCSAWCTALLWIVPAKVGGAWQLPQGQLTLEQEFQMLTGTLAGEPIASGRLRGEEIRFTVGAVEYTGRVTGDRMEGTARNGSSQTPWTATRITSATN